MKKIIVLVLCGALLGIGLLFGANYLFDTIRWNGIEAFIESSEKIPNITYLDKGMTTHSRKDKNGNLVITIEKDD